MMGNVTPLPHHRRLAAEVARVLKDDREISVVDRVVVYQNLSRYWRKFLTPLQLSLALHIVDRTVGWGKVSFTACSANIIHGTEDYASLGMSERSYFRAMKDLEKLGLITRKSRRDRTQITLNVGWSPDAQPPTKAKATSP